MNWLITLIFIFSIVIPAAAVSAAIDPQNITIDDAELGRTYTVIFNVTNPGDVPATYTLIPSGLIQPWMNLSIKNSTIAPKGSYEVNVTITIPEEFFIEACIGKIRIQNEAMEGVDLPITILIKKPGNIIRDIVRYIVIAIILIILLIIFRTKPTSRVRHFKLKS